MSLVQVIMMVSRDLCGAALLNSQFILTAAHCACMVPDVCNQKMGHWDNGPTKIKVNKAKAINAKL